jgi:hypothetical protein
MKVALHVLAYDVGRFINPMLRNAAPWVDRIYIAYPKRPFSYSPESRENKVNPTRVEDIDLRGIEEKVELIHGDWEREEEMRNACLDRARNAGHGWLIIQDADEFYTEDSWRTILRELREAGEDVELFRSPWLTFWKSSEYILEFHDRSTTVVNVGCAIRCAPNLRFVERRLSNARNEAVIDVFCYHYGYVGTDEDMKEKLETWSHSAEVFDLPNWFDCKWRYWNLQTRNLAPTNPVGWHRALPFPHDQPEFAKHFLFPANPNTRKPLDVRFRELLYDARAIALWKLRQLKQAVRGRYPKLFK